MKFFEMFSLLSAAILWVFLIGGWNSTYIQRLIGSFLLARADALARQRFAMVERLEYWRSKT